MLNWVSMPGKPSGGDFQPPTQLNHNSGALPELAKDALEAGSGRWRWVWAEGTAAQRARRWLCSPQVTSPGVSQRSQPPRAIRGGWHSHRRGSAHKRCCPRAQPPCPGCTGLPKPPWKQRSRALRRSGEHRGTPSGVSPVPHGLCDSGTQCQPFRGAAPGGQHAPSSSTPTTAG